MEKAWDSQFMKLHLRIFIFIFNVLARVRKREKERDKGSQRTSECWLALQRLSKELGSSEARNQAGTEGRRLSLTTFRVTLAGTWVGRRAAGIWTDAYVGCWPCDATALAPATRFFVVCSRGTYIQNY